MEFVEVVDGEVEESLSRDVVVDEEVGVRVDDVVQAWERGELLVAWCTKNMATVFLYDP